MKKSLQTFHKLVIRVFDYLFKLVPYKKQVFFISLNGQYNDNPKYISQKLHAIDNEVEIVWAISGRCHEIDLLPEYIKKVNVGSIKATLERNRSIVLVDSACGIKTGIRHTRFSKYVIKRKEQLNISTWHGTPFKKIGCDYSQNPLPPRNKYYTSTDFMIAGCEYTAEKLQHAFYDIPVKLTGTPRNDILFCQQDISLIKQKLHLEKNCNYILYAPTYRDNPYDSGVKQIEEMSVPLLINTVAKKFGGNWKLIYRVHNMVLEKIDHSLLDNELCINGNIGDDMQEYLICSDVIISDYSGAIYDIALTSKPCFLFAHDRENYISNERGSYMDISDLPYTFADTFNQLLSNISNFDETVNEDKRKLFLRKIGNVEDGNASIRIAKMIEEHIRNYDR